MYRDVKIVNGNAQPDSSGSEIESPGAHAGTRLERLAELIRGRWPKVTTMVHSSGDHIRLEQDMDRWMGGFAASYFPAHEDLSNSLFIVWGLDRLEELGCGPVLTINHFGGYAVLTVANPGGHRGYTRAEAIANALAVALEHAPVPAPTEQEGQP